MFFGGLFSTGLDFSLNLLNFTARILFSIYLGAAVYKDAIENKYENAKLWGILVIFFNFIPLIIYIILRQKKEKEMTICKHCGQMVSKKYPICMYCKQPIGDGENKAFISKDVKNYLIIATVFFVIHKVISMILTLDMSRSIHYHIF